MLVPAILFHFFQLISGSLISVKWTPKKEQMELPVTEIKKIPERDPSYLEEFSEKNQF